MLILALDIGAAVGKRANSIDAHCTLWLKEKILQWQKVDKIEMETQNSLQKFFHDIFELPDA